MSGTFQLNEDAMRPIIAKAILDEMGHEQRDLLVQNAIDTMLAPTILKGQYGRPDERQPSMLEQIIRDQTRVIAGKVVAELLEEPEQADRIRTQIRSGILKALTEEDNGWLLSSIGHAAGEAVTKILQEKR